MLVSLIVVVMISGGPFFDPLGFSRGDEESYREYQDKEVKNGRLAMLAFLGFFAQYAATGMHISSQEALVNTCAVYSIDAVQ